MLAGLVLRFSDIKGSQGDRVRSGNAQRLFVNLVPFFYFWTLGAASNM